MIKRGVHANNILLSEFVWLCVSERISIVFTEIDCLRGCETLVMKNISVADRLRLEETERIGGTWLVRNIRLVLCLRLVKCVAGSLGISRSPPRAVGLWNIACWTSSPKDIRTTGKLRRIYTYEQYFYDKCCSRSYERFRNEDKNAVCPVEKILKRKYLSQLIIACRLGRCKIIILKLRDVSGKNQSKYYCG